MINIEIQENNQIAKNTLILYFRMFITLIISLYTSRVVLKALGIVDFGIYNVIGGIVAMFSFFNTAMTSTTQRYIAFSLGKNNQSEQSKIFFNCVLIHFIIAFFFIIFVELIGMWFINNKLTIPPERFSAALSVFHCSVLSTFFLINCVPYNAAIIAHEKMAAYAYISIIEVFFKLAIVLLLPYTPIDRLCSLAILLTIVQLITTMIYIIYCRKTFNETQLRFNYDKNIFKEMLSFTGWNLWGGFSNILYTQGLNILLNIFFGPAINAARGISVQIQSAVIQFSSNFQTAINPQIVKTYANQEIIKMHSLIFLSSRFTTLLLLILATPFFVDANCILHLWLGEIPEWSSTFIQIMLCITIIDSAANPFMIASAATGHIRFYQFAIGGTMLLIVPTSYIALKFGCKPHIVFIIHLFFCICTFVIRLFIVRSLISFKITDYIKKCLSRIIPATTFLLSIVIFNHNIPKENIFQSFFVIGCATILTAAICFTFGLSKHEKGIFLKKLTWKKTCQK